MPLILKPVEIKKTARGRTADPEILNLAAQIADLIRESPGTWIAVESFGKSETEKEKASKAATAYKTRVVKWHDLESYMVQTAVDQDESGNWFYALKFDPNAKPRSTSK